MASHLATPARFLSTKLAGWNSGLSERGLLVGYNLRQVSESFSPSESSICVVLSSTSSGQFVDSLFVIFHFQRVALNSLRSVYTIPQVHFSFDFGHREMHTSYHRKAGNCSHGGGCGPHKCCSGVCESQCLGRLIVVVAVSGGSVCALEALRLK